jgi:hypothetical protein
VHGVSGWHKTPHQNELLNWNTGQNHLSAANKKYLLPIGDSGGKK